MAANGKNKEGLRMEKRVSYDKENDIFAIHNGFSSDEKFKSNIDVGDVVLDMSTKGRVRGIEVLNATDFFKDFGVDEQKFADMTDANFTASIKPNRIVIGIGLKIKNIQKEIPAKIAVPINLN